MDGFDEWLNWVRRQIKKEHKAPLLNLSYLIKRLAEYTDFHIDITVEYLFQNVNRMVFLI